jgi:hypothetical protein
LAFDNAEDAASVLSAFKSDPHIVAAALYDIRGKIFATYPQGLQLAQLPARVGAGVTFGRSALIGFEPVAEDSKQLGVLYVKSVPMPPRSVSRDGGQRRSPGRSSSLRR